MNKFETKFNYDERTKTLKADKIWSIKGEKAIKKILGTLNTQKKGYEDSIVQLKERLAEPPKMSDELQKLKDMLIELQTIDVSEKIKDTERVELEKQKTDTEAYLKEVSLEIGKLKKEIGTRLKL